MQPPNAYDVMKCLGKMLILILLPLVSLTQQNPYWQEPTRKQADSLKSVLAQAALHYCNESVFTDTWACYTCSRGTGVPEKVLDKIFQPFFTTKPTGEGTGLGLSLSYDIVTKGHGGQLKVKTVENGGSEFIITLPT